MLHTTLRLSIWLPYQLSCREFPKTLLLAGACFCVAGRGGCSNIDDALLLENLLIKADLDRVERLVDVADPNLAASGLRQGRQAAIIEQQASNSAHKALFIETTGTVKLAELVL